MPRAPPEHPHRALRPVAFRCVRSPRQPRRRHPQHRSPGRARGCLLPGNLQQSSSAAKSAADRGPHATVPAPRPTPPADHSIPTALAAVDRGRSAPSPAKRAGVAQLDGHSRPQPEAAGASGGSAQPPHRARRSRYIPAPVRREVWRRDGGCCSYVDPHSGRRCGSRFLLELDHIVPFALGGSAEPGNLRVKCGVRDNAESHELIPSRKGFDTRITMHYPGARSEAISASGALNLPRRSCGGSTASMASSFSVGSTRR